MIVKCPHPFGFIKAPLAGAWGKTLFGQAVNCQLSTEEQLIRARAREIVASVANYYDYFTNVSFTSFIGFSKKKQPVARFPLVLL